VVQAPVDRDRRTASIAIMYGVSPRVLAGTRREVAPLTALGCSAKLRMGECL